MAIKWPWAGGDDPVDDSDWEEGVEEGDTGEEEPSLDDLDEEAQAIAQKLIDKQLAGERAIREKMVVAARESGIEITGDGTVAFRDPSAVASRLGVRREEAQAPAAVPQTPAEEPPPSPLDDPTGYVEYMRRQMEASFRAQMDEALSPLRAENAELKGLVFDRETSDAVQRGTAAVKTQAPWLEGALAHPDFAPEYAAALKGQTAANLRDPKFLAGVAGYVATQLDPTRAAPATPPRNAKGQFVPGQVSYELGRSTVGAPLREGTTAREAPSLQLDEQGKKILRTVQQYGGPLTMDDLEDLQYSNYEEYKKARARRKAPAGRR